MGLTRSAAIGANHDKYESIRNDIEREIEAGRATGVAVTLTHKGEITWQEGFGWADKEGKTRATPNTSFSLASVTKAFTTTALMILVAAGKVSLDAPANEYLGPDKIKGGAGDPAKVTLRTLASHSGGMPGIFTIYPENGPEKQPSMEQVIRDYAFVAYPTGKYFNYSNVGLGIVAHIVARESHHDFGEYLQEEVLKPLGLNHSFFDTDLARRAQMAQRYDNTGNALPFYVTSTPGTGELYASAHDVARFAMFHLKDQVEGAKKILSNELIDELHQPRIQMIADRSYGLGWMVGKAYDGSTVIYHNGNQPGVATVMMLLPSRDIACVVLTNQDADEALMERVRDAAIRTLVPEWSWKTYDLTTPEALPSDLQGHWHGAIEVGTKSVPVDLTISETESMFRIEDHSPQPITGLGLADGLMVGRTRGELEPVDTKQVDLSLRLVQNGAQLSGEIDLQRPIAHVRTPSVTPFWIHLSM